MDYPDASAELHPRAGDDSDSTAAPQPSAPAQKRGRGRPARLPSTPEVERARKADRERKRRVRLGLKPLKRGAKGSATAETQTDDENAAAAAVAAGAERRRDRGGAAAPKRRQAGWLRQLLETTDAGTGRAVSQIRHLALQILERDGLPWAQEVLADPDAKDSDKGRAVDLLAKLGAGYITPDQAGAEDVPDLPAPIFQLSEGALPGEDGVPLGMLSEEDSDGDDTGGPQLAPDTPSPPPSTGAGPVPHMGAA